MSNKFIYIFFPNDSKAEHFKSLDGLRGIAILFVVLSHSSKVGIMFSSFLNFETSGKFGIYLFFVLSAYLLDRQISLALFSNRVDANFWKRYLLKRILRIYPAYIAALIVYWILNLYGFSTVIDEVMDIPKHILLFTGESIFWSIQVEFKYYLISPFILLFCHKYLKWNLMRVLTFVSFLICVAMACHYFFRLQSDSTFGYFPVFLVGTYIAIVEFLKIDEIEKYKNSILLDACGIIGALIILCSVPYYFQLITGFRFLHRPLIYTPYSILWGIILVAAKYGKGAVKWFLELKVLRFFGAVSFSMYLFHLPILVFFNLNTSLPEESKIYLFFLVTILVSSISYLLIERPFSKTRLLHSLLGIK